MDDTAWTVAGAAVTILVAILVSFRSLRGEMRAQSEDIAQLRVDVGILKDARKRQERRLEVNAKELAKELVEQAR